VRSNLFTISLQRRLGLPISALMQTAGDRAELRVLLGDVALGRGAEHSTRHHRVVNAWVAATQAAHGVPGTYATVSAPTYTAPAVPDFVSEFRGQDGAHIVGDVKVYNPILTTDAWMRRGAAAPFGATEPPLRSELLGAAAADTGASLGPTYRTGPRAGQPRAAHYQAALDGGHSVVPLITEVWGGFASEAVSYLRGLAQTRGGRIDVERLSTTWSTRSFSSYYGQLLSIAVTTGVAIEIWRTAQSAHATRAGHTRAA